MKHSKILLFLITLSSLSLIGMNPKGEKLIGIYIGSKKRERPINLVLGTKQLKKAKLQDQIKDSNDQNETHDQSLIAPLITFCDQTEEVIGLYDNSKNLDINQAYIQSDQPKESMLNVSQPLTELAQQKSITFPAHYIILKTTLSNIKLQHFEYDNNNKECFYGSGQLKANTPVCISLIQHASGKKDEIGLHQLPSYPQAIVFSIPQPSIHYGNTVHIEENDTCVNIKNLTTNQTLATLPKKTRSVHIGKKERLYYPDKTISIVNVNLPYITITNRSYKYETPQNITLSNVLVYSKNFTLAETYTIKAQLLSFLQDRTIINSELILSIPCALQKIKIWPSENLMSENDTIFIKYNSDTTCIELTNQNNSISRTIYTKSTVLRI